MSGSPQWSWKRSDFLAENKLPILGVRSYLRPTTINNLLISRGVDSAEAAARWVNTFLRFFLFKIQAANWPTFFILNKHFLGMLKEVCVLVRTETAPRTSARQQGKHSPLTFTGWKPNIRPVSHFEPPFAQQILHSQLSLSFHADSNKFIHLWFFVHKVVNVTKQIIYGAAPSLCDRTLLAASAQQPKQQLDKIPHWG